MLAIFALLWVHAVLGSQSLIPRRLQPLSDVSAGTGIMQPFDNLLNPDERLSHSSALTRAKLDMLNHFSADEGLGMRSADKAMAIRQIAFQKVSKWNTLFPYHGITHALRAGEMMAELFAKNVGLHEGHAHSQIAKFAMTMHDLGYDESEADRKQLFEIDYCDHNLHRNRRKDFGRVLDVRSDVAMDLESPLEDTEYDETVEPVKEIVRKLGESHESFSILEAVATTICAGMWSHKEPKTEFKNLIDLASTISATKLGGETLQAHEFMSAMRMLHERIHGGWNPEALTKGRSRLCVQASENPWMELPNDPFDEKKFKAIYRKSRVRTESLRRYAEAADFANFWLDPTDQPPAPTSHLCQMIALFAEFFAHGGTMYNIMGQPQPDYPSQLKDEFLWLLNGQPGFFQFVIKPKFEAAGIIFHENQFLSLYEDIKRKIEKMAVVYDSSSPPNSPHQWSLAEIEAAVFGNPDESVHTPVCYEVRSTRDGKICTVKSPKV